MQISSYLSFLIHTFAKRRVGVLLALLSLGIATQAQTISFTYDNTGGVTSRIAKETAPNVQSLPDADIDTSDVLKVKVPSYPKLGNELTIECTFSKPEVSKVSYALSNTFGQLYLRGTLSEGINQVNTSQLPSGIYLLKVDDGENSKSFRLIKE